jgi:hypothetical protein
MEDSAGTDVSAMEEVGISVHGSKRQTERSESD